MVEVETCGGQHLTQSNHCTLGVQTLWRCQNQDAGVEAIEHAHTYNRKSGGQRHIKLCVRWRDDQHFAAHNGGTIWVHVEGCSVTSDQLAQMQAPHIFQNRRVHLPNSR